MTPPAPRYRPPVTDWDGWRAGVLELVAEADAAARELGAELVREARRGAGRCVGCGVDYEQRTQGCRSCSTRFAVRAWNERRRAAELDTLGRRVSSSASSHALTEQPVPQGRGVGAGGGALAEPLSSAPA